MDVEQKPPWSGKKLAKLGEAIISGGNPPNGCSSYPEVMAWHSDLCGEVATQISLHEPWRSYSGAFDVSARAKTVDTLRDKLMREQNMRLNQVQDLAGVRIDMDGTLDEQTAFAQEVAEFFGGSDRVEVRDIRKAPQNTYERLGDRVGRHIRYGEPSDGPFVREIVARMHQLSNSLAAVEKAYQDLLEAMTREFVDTDRGLEELRALKSHGELLLHQHIDYLKRVERILDGKDEMEAGDSSAGIRD